MSGRNFKRLPGTEYKDIPKMDDELNNIVKQLNLFGDEVVVKDTSKDLFEIQKYNKLLKINRDTATLGDVVDFVATMAIKLGELKAFNTKVSK
jgi:hypothetical protein